MFPNETSDALSYEKRRLNCASMSTITGYKAHKKVRNNV